VAVGAAVSLAASYLRQGDRVALADLGRPQYGLTAGSGRRQLLRLRHRLVRCVQAAGWAPRAVLRPEQVPAGALLVVLSPFLDDGVVQATITAARRGDPVLAIDVLPEPLRPDPGTPWGPAALAVLRVERRVRLDALARHGAVVVRWQDGIPGAALRRLTRARPPVGISR
jgi:hypothetical protein